MPPPQLNLDVRDSFSVFDQGMNSGVAAVLLSKNQIAFASNATVRGAYLKPRPPHQVFTLDFGGNAALQTAVTKGLWQQACYYKYDSGLQIVIAAISGRLFKFVPGTTTAVVTEITGGNPQSATAPQHWMVQAEYFLIWTDGINLPVYFNGNLGTTARSTGNAVVAGAYSGKLTVAFSKSPPINVGDVVTLNISPAYTGIVTDFLQINGLQFKVSDLTSTTVIKATAQFSYNPGVINPPSLYFPVGTALSQINTPPPTLPQLPAGRNLAYILGRVIIALTDGKQYIYGDISGGTSGTLANNFRDAVIYCAENSYITGGGTFSIPGQQGSIRAFVESAVLDVALGQGPLQVHTPDRIYSCAVPVDRSTWQSVTNPILTVSLIGSGGLGQNSSVIVNSDTLFRTIDGLGSLILARRDFNTWGNVPISREVTRIISKDAQSLLPWGTGANFDNRFLMSVGPTSSSQGVYHQGLIALNFDPISTIRGKAPSVYDGLWTGLNTLQLVSGEFSLVQRCFAFTLDPVAGNIGLSELLPSNTALTQDSGATPLVWGFESPVIFHDPEERNRKFKRLMAGELSVDSIIGQVDFSVFYRPDDYPNWIPWASWSECAGVAPGAAPQFRPRMGLGEPDSKDCDETTGRPLREGYFFQVKVVVQGSCRFKVARFSATEIPEPKFAAPKCSTICANPTAADV